MVAYEKTSTRCYSYGVSLQGLGSQGLGLASVLSSHCDSKSRLWSVRLTGSEARSLSVVMTIQAMEHHLASRLSSTHIMT